MRAMTALRRARLLGEFEDFVQTETEWTIADLARHDLPTLSGLMREHGFNLYDGRRPCGDLKDAILGVTDLHAYARPAMTEAWRVVKTWERLEPHTVRTPLPYSIYRAARATALAWGWARLAMILHIAYFCLLRPVEIFGLKRSDVWIRSTPDGTELLVRLARTKSWARRSRSQYAKLDACFACACSNLFLRSMPDTARLWPGSPAAFGLRYQKLLDAVLRTPHPFTAASLRTGGATMLFREWREDLPRLCWRGRWTDPATLWHYVQEL